MHSQIPTSGDQESQSSRKPRFHFWQCFWLSFLVISLSYAWYCFYVPSNSVAWAENYAAARTKAVKTEKPVLLYFTGQWCVPCRVMKRQVWADEEVAAFVNSKFVPVLIDVDNPDAADVLARYNVRGAPVTIITDQQGNAIRWRDGGLEKPEFLKFLEETSLSVKTL